MQANNLEAAFNAINTRSGTAVGYKKLKADCWQQILRLLSNQDFHFASSQWPAFVELVSWHHILIDVLPRLAEANYCEFTEQQIAQLDTSRLKLRKNALRLCQVQNQLSRYLLDKDIRHLFFKGTVLSQWLYGASTLRQCRDIDIAVHPQDHAHACSKLEELGCTRIIPKPDISGSAFKRYQRAMKDVSYMHRGSSCVIELHWALRPFPQAFEFDFDMAYEQRQLVEVEGASIPAFSDLLHARYIAAHGCLSHWARLRWLLDWQQLASKSQLDWSLLINSASTDKEIQYMNRAFQLAYNQLGAPIPKVFDNLATPIGNHYCLKKHTDSQAKARYPNWLQRQILNLAHQEGIRGMHGYAGYMLKKMLAADTV